jgi:O-antigen ligase
MFSFKSFILLKNDLKYLFPLFAYFIILTTISIYNIVAPFNDFFDFPFFLNILVFYLLTRYSNVYPNILLKGLLVFSISTFVLSLLYFLGIGITDSLEGLDGRSTVFGMNQNFLGLSLCISIFTIISIVMENKLELGKRRFVLLSLLPFMFVFLISTGSRVAFISLILGLFLFIYFNKSYSSVKKSTIIVASLLVFLLFSLVFLKNSLVVERLSNSVNEGDLSSRDLIWINLYNIIKNNYVFGIGKTGYAMVMNNNSLFEGVPSPHNVLIEVLCYTGIVGLIVFIFFIYRILCIAYQKNKLNTEILPLVLFIPVLGMILSDQIFDQKIAWILFAYLASNTNNSNVKYKMIIRNKHSSR